LFCFVLSCFVSLFVCEICFPWKMVSGGTQKILDQVFTFFELFFFSLISIILVGFSKSFQIKWIQSLVIYGETSLCSKRGGPQQPESDIQTLFPEWFIHECFSGLVLLFMHNWTGCLKLLGCTDQLTSAEGKNRM